ncbi:hypothetical protein J5N97_012982 [Dioscorea zingiberensis]|uniref:Uncharacterized protein n=1 Tax=Dioscorea zingiberensis TaxID=325984 RepID=A0A9D5HIC8_9LILI|nr:hypothetical protein J5N97_012982 [Dioscorea zingiberensis]
MPLKRSRATAFIHRQPKAEMETIPRRPKPQHPHFSLLCCYALLIVLSVPRASAGGPIKTVVVLVMENRSFDHMLGWMKKLNPEINGVTGSESNPVSTSDPSSPRVYFKDEAHYVDPDPGHSFQAIREQIFGSNDTSASTPPMDGFLCPASRVYVAQHVRQRHERLPA